MKEQFYKEQFKARSLTSALWALTARRLKRAADLIFEAYTGDLAAMAAGTSPLELYNLELAGCASLLYGLALENAIKAIIISNTPDLIVNCRIKKGSILLSHDQIRLVSQTDIVTNAEEKDLLIRMTAFIKWAGRYPIPISEQEMRLCQQNVQSDFVPLPIQPHERNAVNRLYKKLESRSSPNSSLERIYQAHRHRGTR